MWGFCLDIDLNKLIIKEYFWYNSRNVYMEWVIDDIKDVWYDKSMLIMWKIVFNS